MTKEIMKGYFDEVDELILQSEIEVAKEIKCVIDALICRRLSELAEKIKHERSLK